MTDTDNTDTKGCRTFDGTAHLEPGWGCCGCRTYNGQQRTHCMACDHQRCDAWPQCMVLLDPRGGRVDGDRPTLAGPTPNVRTYTAMAMDESQLPVTAQLAQGLLEILTAHGCTPDIDAPEWGWQLGSALLGAICEAHRIGDGTSREIMLDEATILTNHAIESYAAAQRCGHVPEQAQPFARLLTEHVAATRRAEMSVVPDGCARPAPNSTVALDETQLRLVIGRRVSEARAAENTALRSEVAEYMRRLALLRAENATLAEDAIASAAASEKLRGWLRDNVGVPQHVRDGGVITVQDWALVALQEQAADVGRLRVQVADRVRQP